MGRSSSQRQHQQEQQDYFVQHSNSYQHTLTIQQLDEPPPPTTSERLHQFASNPGNSFLQPNVGRTNRYDYDIFGLTLAELLERLRWSMFTSTAWLLVVLTLTWWQRFLRPKALCASIVLAVLDGGLLVAVATRPLDAGYSGTTSGPKQDNNNSTATPSSVQNGVWTTPQRLLGLGGSNHEDPPSAASSSAAVMVDRVVYVVQCVDDWSKCVLDHPLGKTAAMSLCAFLCFWTVHGPWEFLVGLSFVVEASILLYCWVFYPEFRRVFATSSHSSTGRAAPAVASTRSWSHYASTAAGKDAKQKENTEETDSLLFRSASQ